MTSGWDEIESAFERALQLEGQAQTDFLNSLDPLLAGKVTELLQPDDTNDQLLRDIVGASARGLAGSSGQRWLGRRIGPYRIIEQIAQGGMGAVFLAQREDDAYEQQVAIKIMGSHLPSTDAIKRFRGERQILANLRHPNIAQLLDGGTTEDHLPFLVMEYIDGLPVSKYVEQHQLSLKDRLRLFMQICEAVDYAHRNLIVHRDLKPSNILVTEDGTVKLLDFGIAKLIDAEHSTDLTQAGGQAMTLSYASPEQVRGETISVASDVYALGVLLYYLLTEQSPYEADTSNPHALQSSILEQEPQRPSAIVTKVSTTFRTYDLDPQAVQHMLSGDLDNIVLMAIRKETQQRYSTVAELRNDIARHLDNRPVVAHRSNWWYRCRKFLRRNALATAATAAGLATIVALTVGFTLRLAAERDTAQQERNTAEQVSGFVIDVFRNADPNQSRGAQLTVREALDSGVTQLNQSLQDAPVIKARVQRAIAQVYYGLGSYDQTLALAQQSIDLQQQAGSDALPEALDTQELLGDTLINLTEYDKALEVLEHVYQRRKALLGDGHADTVNVIASLGDLYGRMGQTEQHLATCEPALEAARALTATAEKTWLMVCVASGYARNGRKADAIVQYEEAAALQKAAWGEDDPTYLTTLSDMAIFMNSNAEELARADSIFSTVLAARYRVLGSTHPAIAQTLNNRAISRMIANELSGAEADILEAIAMYRASPLDTQELGMALTNAAKIKFAQFDMQGAIDFANEAVPLLKTNSHSTNEFLGTAHQQLARALAALGEKDQAKAAYQASLAEYEKSYGADHPRVLAILRDQVLATLKIDDIAGAVALTDALLERSRRSDHSRALHDATVVAIRVSNSAEDYQQAQDLIGSINDTVLKEYGESSQQRGIFLGYSADTAEGLGQHQQALVMRKDALELIASTYGADHPYAGTLHVGMGRSLVALRRFEEADEAVQVGLAILVERLGEDHSTTRQARGLLGSIAAELGLDAG